MDYPSLPGTSDYYVSVENGNDNNDGTSEAQAFATLTKLFTVVEAGDFCAIAPGNYRELLTFSILNSEETKITIFGDKNCRYFQNETSGIVRITGCDEDEQAQAETHIIYSPFGYYNFVNFIVDGIKSELSDKYAVYAVNIGRITFYDSNIYGYTDGTKDIDTYRCFVMAGNVAISQGNYHEKSIAFGGSVGFNYPKVSAEQCIGIGAYTQAFVNNPDIPLINCTALFSRIGFNNAGILKNGLAFGCTTGVMGNGSHHAVIAYCNQYAGTDGDVSNITVISSGSAYGNYTGTPTISDKAILFRPDVADRLKQAFEIFMMSDQTGDDTVELSSSTDVMDKIRRAVDGTINSGAHEFQDIEPDFVNYDSKAPAVKINRKGQKIIKATVRGDRSYSVKCQVKFDSDSEKKPQLIVSGASIIEQSDTASGSGSSFEELCVNIGTPEFDDVIEIKLYARDEASGKYAIFSDIEVQS